jgi:hypothetical protein
MSEIGSVMIGDKKHIITRDENNAVCVKPEAPAEVPTTGAAGAGAGTEPISGAGKIRKAQKSAKSKKSKRQSSKKLRKSAKQSKK